jgi:type VI protein secretion system component Hcp
MPKVQQAGTETGPAEIISRQVKLLALFIAAILVTAGFVAATNRASTGGTPRSTPHYLGERGLELAAFAGGAKIYLRLTMASGGPIGPATAHAAKPDPHAADIPVTTMSVSLSTSNDLGSGSGGAGAGKVTFGTLVLKRHIDQFSEPLVKALLTGEKFKSATLFVLPSGSPKSPAEVLTIRLKPALVTEDDYAASPSAATETLNLSFIALSLSYSRGSTTSTTPTVTPSPTATVVAPN